MLLKNWIEIDEDDYLNSVELSKSEIFYDTGRNNTFLLVWKMHKFLLFDRPFEMNWMFVPNRANIHTVFENIRKSLIQDF